MDDAFEITAFHKSGPDAADRAVARQAYEVSYNKERDEKHKLWLGDGIYFWENFSDALKWKGYRYENNWKISKADLHCRKESMLDLDTDEDLAKLSSFWRYFTEKVTIQGEYDVEFLHDSLVDGITCDIYKKFNGIKLIKYSFPYTDGRPQFCATNNEVISNIRIVKENITGNGDIRNGII